MSWLTEQILTWGALHGRRNLPWQQHRTPYRVWVSEIMLQQTQVSVVEKHFERFLDRFPSLETLATTTDDEVLNAWYGLGYYQRALRLRQAALLVIKSFSGEIPHSVEELQQLPGIGRSTAGAIVSASWDIRAPILEANVKRVLTRFHGLTSLKQTKVSDSVLWRLAESHTPTSQCRGYNQAIMDIGATLCTSHTPACERCPLSQKCVAYGRGTVVTKPHKASQERCLLKRKFVVLYDSKRRWFLVKRSPEGMFARLWDTPEISLSQNLTDLINEYGFNESQLIYETDFSVKPYAISNKYVQETVIVAKYTKYTSTNLTNQEVRWFTEDELLKIGTSVKTLARIKLVQQQLEAL